MHIRCDTAEAFLTNIRHHEIIGSFVFANMSSNFLSEVATNVGLTLTTLVRLGGGDIEALLTAEIDCGCDRTGNMAGSRLCSEIMAEVTAELEQLRINAESGRAGTIRSAGISSITIVPGVLSL